MTAISDEVDRTRMHHPLRRWRRLALLAVAAVALAACGSGSGGSGTAQSTGKGAVKGSIAFSWWGSQTRNTKTYTDISLFEKAYPKATISGEPNGNYTDYWQKLTVEAAAKNMPCVPQMQTRYMTQYDTRGGLMPLDALAKSGAIDISSVSPSIIKGGRGPDGKLYMIGTGAATTTLVYNTTMAKAAGLPALTAGMSWQDYANWLSEAKSHLPSGVYATDLQGGSDAMLFAWVRSHGQQVFVADGSGGYKLGFTKQTLVDFWNWWAGVLKSGAATPPGMMAEEPTTSGADYLAQGRVLTEVDTSNVSADQASLDAAHAGTAQPVMFPRGPAGNNGDVFDVSGLSISANCTNVATAAAWVNFFTNNAAATKAYGSDNGAVTVPKYLSQQISDPSLAPPIKTSLDFLQTMYKANRPVAFYPSGYNTIVANLTTDYSDVAFGKLTAQQAADQFFSQASTALS